MKWHSVVGLMPEFSPSQMSLGKSATSVCLQVPFGKMLGYKDSIPRDVFQPSVLSGSGGHPGPQLRSSFKSFFMPENSCHAAHSFEVFDSTASSQ